MRTVQFVVLLLLVGGQVGAQDLEDSSTKPPRSSSPASKNVLTNTDPATVSCPADGVRFLPTGFTFSALLPDAIFSYNTIAPTIAIVEDDVKFRNLVIIPKGTRLVGTASTLHTLDRVNINMSLVVLPDGCEFPLSAIALSADDGSAGIKGKVQKHEDSIAARIALKSVLSAGTAAASIVAPIEGAVVGNLANEGTQVIDQDLAKVKSLTSIYVHERMPIRIFVLRRFIRDGVGR
jgi:type IV secretory pathway VirB10-like protein